MLAPVPAYSLPHFVKQIDQLQRAWQFKLVASSRNFACILAHLLKHRQGSKVALQISALSAKPSHAVIRARHFRPKRALCRSCILKSWGYHWVDQLLPVYQHPCSIWSLGELPGWAAAALHYQHLFVSAGLMQAVHTYISGATTHQHHQML